MSNKYNTTIKQASGREVKEDIYIENKYQVRSQGLNKDHVKDLVTALFNGAQFPDLNVLCTSKNGKSSYYLVGGFHRVAAYQKALSIQKELRKISEKSEEYTNLDEEQLHRRNMTLKPLGAQQVGNTFTFPISGNSEDEANYWKDVRAATYLYGCTSNSDRTLGMSKADVGECMQKYLRLCRETTKTQMAKRFNVDRKTVTKYCESIYREFKEEAVTRAFQLIKANPNISARELSERCPNLGGEKKVEAFLRKAKFEGEDAAREVIFPSAKCPCFPKMRKATETPKGSQEEPSQESTKTPEGKSPNQPTEPKEPSAPNENKQPNDVKTNQTGVGFGEESPEPQDSPEKPMGEPEDSQGALLDYDALAYRYLTLEELPTEDIETMLDPDIAEQVRKIARKQVERNTHNLRQQVKELEHETSNQQTQIDQLKAALSEAQDQLASFEESKDKPVEFPKALAVPKPNTDMHDVLKQCRTLRATKDSKVFRDDIYDETVMKYSQLEGMSLSMRKAELKDAKGKPEADVVAIRSEAYALFDLHTVRGE